LRLLCQFYDFGFVPSKFTAHGYVEFLNFHSVSEGLILPYADYPNLFTSGLLTQLIHKNFAILP